MKEDIINKKIGLFVENGIDKYRRNEEIKTEEMIKVYLDNNGFLIINDKDSKFIGYLDLADIEKIKILFEKIKEYRGKTIKELIQDNKINLRCEKIDYNTSLLEALMKLNRSEQNYYPVFNGEILIGRISKLILKEKIKDLY